MQLLLSKGLRIATLSVGLVGAATVLWTQAPQVQADPPPPPLLVNQYIQTPAQIDPAWIQDLDTRPGVIRYRIFELDLPAQLPTDATAFTVNLFPDLSFTTPTRNLFVTNPTHFSWFGSVIGDVTGQLGFTYNTGKIAGTGYVEGHHLQISRLAPDIYVIAETLPPPSGECGVD